MKIHGIRIYPQSVKTVRGGGSPIFIHGRVSEEYSDFFYIFRSVAALWRGHFFANEFIGSYDKQMRIVAPMRELREQFGSSLLSVDAKSQLLLLKGDDFEQWGTSLRFDQGALLPIFSELPKFALVKKVYCGRDFRLSSKTWPTQIRGLIHMWDDIYRQFFSTERSDVDALVREHTGDSKLKMYFVDLDEEFPDPSNKKLRPALLNG
jgi:hypothetical protein